MSENVLDDLAHGVSSTNDQAFAIETNGINSIPLTERHGTPRDLFWIWFAANVGFTYIIIGSLAVVLGLGFWPAAAAVVIGNLVYFLVGLAAIPGPKAATATIVAARSAFGVLGTLPSTFLSWITVVGWEAVMVVIGTLSLSEIAVIVGLPEGNVTRAASLVIVMVATFTVSIWGHATILAMNKILSVLLGVGTLIMGILVLPHLDVSFAGGELAAPSTLATWLIAVTIIAALPLSWVNYPADYSRYLSPSTSSRSIALNTAFGSAIPAVLIGLVGVAAATATDMSDPLAGLRNLLPVWFLVPYLLVIVGGTITNNFLNTYSSGLNLQALGVKLPRHKAVLIDAVLAGIASIYAVFVFDFTSSFIQFLSLMIIWLAPWLGIYLADIWLRRNTYEPAALHQRGGGRYWYQGGWNWPALAAFAAGIIAAALFANAPIYVGPLVPLIGGGDISILAGFIVAGLLHVVLARRTATPVDLAAQTNGV